MNTYLMHITINKLTHTVYRHVRIGNIIHVEESVFNTLQDAESYANLKGSNESARKVTIYGQEGDVIERVKIDPNESVEPIITPDPPLSEDPPVDESTPL